MICELVWVGIFRSANRWYAHGGTDRSVVTCSSHNLENKQILKRRSIFVRPQDLTDDNVQQ